MTIVMIVIACPAADLGGFAIHQRNYRVVCDPAALDAVIVNDVSKPLFRHTRARLSGVYQVRDGASVSKSI